MLDCNYAHPSCSANNQGRKTRVKAHGTSTITPNRIIMIVRKIHSHVAAVHYQRRLVTENKVIGLKNSTANHDSIGRTLGKCSWEIYSSYHIKITKSNDLTSGNEPRSIIISDVIEKRE